MSSSYNNERPLNMASGDVEYPSDPASGAFFQADFKKNDDLKMMLDSSKDSSKLEAMKRIIGMIAKGRDASDLFPAVVKNVVSKNIEVKKLVYVYLVRYAEEQQDLALLSISTFQRALKDPNQLIRASALRVLSSIRVGMIVPIVMLAIRESASDMSPYVRKTAAHAIPKLFTLDPEQKEELMEIIEKLLSDKEPLVIGSAAMAFSEVCPERSDMLHKSYRKLCALLVDVDEWGQQVLLSVLTNYARQHFPDPNGENVLTSSESDDDKNFYSDTEGSEKESKKRKTKKSSPSLHPDHRLLLRMAKPLLQSRNSAVVMTVAQLFYHAGPVSELAPAAKSMVRLLRGPVEVQSVVLHSIASLTVSNPSIFEPHLKSFFIRTSDPTHIRILKLEILTNLATEATVPVILKELQTYIGSSDKAFAGASIQSIGRLAATIEQVSETCLNGLLQLLSCKDEWVVGSAVEVVKRVLVPERSSGAVRRCARLLRNNRLNSESARAAALWLITAHGSQSHHASAVLAHILKNFADEEELVKLQLLTLAAKLSVTQPNTLPLSRYLITLCRYDPSYDVRDRARYLRRFIEPETREKIYSRTGYILLQEKHKADMHSAFKGRQEFTLGSLSHYLGTRATGYNALPQFPNQVLGAADREASQPEQIAVERTKDKTRENNFYSEPESSGSESSSSDSSSSSESDEEEDVKKNGETKENNKKKSESESGTNESESDSSSDESSNDDNEKSEASSSDNGDMPKNNIEMKKAQKQPTIKKPEKTNLDLLLELDEVASTLPILVPSYEKFIASNPTTPARENIDIISPTSAHRVPAQTVELLSHVIGNGLSATCRFVRMPHLYSNKMASMELKLQNHSNEPISNVRISKKILSGGQSIHEFNPVPSIGSKASVTVTLGVDFADTIQPIKFAIHSSIGEKEVSINPPVGELINAVDIHKEKWTKEQERLRGLTQSEKQCAMVCEPKDIVERVCDAANLNPIAVEERLFRFAGQTLSSKDLVLVSVALLENNECKVVVNCPNITVCSLLCSFISDSLKK